MPCSGGGQRPFFIKLSHAFQGKPCYGAGDFFHQTNNHMDIGTIAAIAVLVAGGSFFGWRLTRKKKFFTDKNPDDGIDWGNF